MPLPEIRIDAGLPCGTRVEGLVGSGGIPSEMGPANLSPGPQPIVRLAARIDHLDEAGSNELLEGPLDRLDLHADDASHHPPLRDRFEGIHGAGVLSEIREDGLLHRVVSGSIRPGHVSQQEQRQGQAVRSAGSEAGQGLGGMDSGAGGKFPRWCQGLMREEGVCCGADFSAPAGAGSSPPQAGGIRPGRRRRSWDRAGTS